MLGYLLLGRMTTIFMQIKDLNYPCYKKFALSWGTFYNKSLSFSLEEFSNG